MLLLLLALSLSDARKLQLRTGHQDLYLNEDTTLYLTIGIRQHAFVTGTRNFLYNSILRIIDRSSHRDIDGTTLKSSSVSISGDRAEIYFTANSACRVEIWILSADVCPNGALLLGASDAYTLDLTMTDRSTFCVFPLMSRGRTLKVSAPTGGGRVAIRTESGTEECGRGVCEVKLTAGGFALFERASGSASLRGDGSADKSLSDVTWFTYVSVTEMAMLSPAIANLEVQSQHNAARVQQVEEDSDDSDFWEIVGFIVIFIVIILVASDCFGHFSFHGFHLPPTVYGGYDGYDHEVYRGRRYRYDRESWEDQDDRYDRPVHRHVPPAWEHPEGRWTDRRDQWEEASGRPLHRNVPPPDFARAYGMASDDRPVHRNLPPPAPPAFARAYGMASDDRPVHRNLPPPAPPAFARATPMASDDRPVHRNLPPPAPAHYRRVSSESDD
jgi:hypothetical protein